MKRFALWCIALSLAGAGALKAQALTMQMSNGWAFTFSGNVNAFLMYTDGKVNTPGAIVGGLVPAEQVSRIRTGLLPGFATFEAKGKEAGLDLGVHFGFAPQINSNSLHDNFGAQIDFRQMYLTVGGSWGQILAGREIGLFERQNILTDMTLFGTGASGGGLGAGGTTLGRIGFGYIYPNFNAQITYSTPAGKPAQLSIGLFDPSVVCGPNPCASASDASYQGTKTPRLEAEASWTGTMGTAAEGASANKIMLWVNGMFQNTKQSVSPDASPNNSITSAGAGGGIKLDVSGFSLMGSGYYGDGVGTTLMFGQLDGSAVDFVGGKRKSYGYIGQITFTPTASKWTVGASYGSSMLKQTDAEIAAETGADLVKDNSAFDGMLTLQWTKALKWVAEYTYAQSKAFSAAKTSSNQVATGLMLTF
jgi:hypothetical protein